MICISYFFAKKAVFIAKFVPMTQERESLFSVIEGKDTSEFFDGLFRVGGIKIQGFEFITEEIVIDVGNRSIINGAQILYAGIKQDER